MCPVIGDFFPNQDRKEFSKRNIIAGKIVKCHSAVAGKDKRLLIIGTSKDGMSVATLRFNTDKYFTKNKLLSQLEVFFTHAGRDYLDHDCYLSCIKVEIVPYKIIFDRLVTNPEDLLGTMNNEDFDSACTTAVNAHTAIPNDIDDFGLSNYRLEIKR